MKTTPSLIFIKYKQEKAENQSEWGKKRVGGRGGKLGFDFTRQTLPSEDFLANSTRLSHLLLFFVSSPRVKIPLGFSFSFYFISFFCSFLVLSLLLCDHGPTLCGACTNLFIFF